jgi:hypothetical protein
MRAANGGKPKYGDVETIIAKYSKCGYEFVTRRNLIYRLSLMSSGKEMRDEMRSTPVDVLTLHHDTMVLSLTEQAPTDATTPEAVEESEVVEAMEEETVRQSTTSNGTSTSTTQDEEWTNFGGRKRGSTNAAKEAYLRKVQVATTLATNLYQTSKDEYGKKGLRVLPGTLTRIISQVEADNELPANTIKKKTVLSRIQSRNLDGTCWQKVSPINDVEPLVADWCIKLAKMGKALTRDQVVGLMEELIAGTVYEQRLRDFKNKRGLLKGNNEQQRLLGKAWYKGFMFRHKDKLKRGKCRIKDVNRHTWCTYENFANMYEGVYDAMVSAGVAEKLDHEVMLDFDGNEVDDESQMFGRPTKYRLLHPENCLFVDETGCNTNQKEDGNIGGRLFVLPVDSAEAGVTGVCTDLHFTVLCFTSGTGEPVLCAVILKSEKDIKDIPISWKLGIDIRRDIISGETDYEVLAQNVGNNKAMHGGPRCTFNGKTLPCFVGTSPKASITSQLLVEMLKCLDEARLFDRSTGHMPFLLLDGHQSRMQLPFLQYINDNQHQWMVCIGVPYGTHLWQVADSSELNGCFKIALAKAKLDYIQYKSQSRQRFVPSDIIPLVDMAWKDSFARSIQARKAIKMRGWGPLNYALLNHPRLIQKPNQPTEQASEPNNPPIDLTVMNTNGPAVTGYVDQLLQDKMKDDGRRRRFNADRERGRNNEQRLDALNRITKLSSGQLAVNDHWRLTDKELLLKAQAKQDSEDQQKQQAAARRYEQTAKSQEKFIVAYNKYASNQNLHSEDLKALIKKVKKKDDTPLRSKITELREQWNRRKHRLMDFVLPRTNEMTVTSTGTITGTSTSTSISASVDVVVLNEQRRQDHVRDLFGDDARVDENEKAAL